MSETTPESKPLSSRLLPIVRLLFILATLLWLARGVYSLVRMQPVTLEMGITPLVIPVLMIGNAAALLLSSIGISKKRNFIFYFAIILLLLNILLVAVGKFGVFGIVAVGFDMLLLALLPMLPPWSNKATFTTTTDM